MAKKSPRYDFRKFSGLTDNHPYRTVRNLSKNEVKPILDLLTSDKIDETAKKSLRKYLVCLLISALEHFFKNEARLLVDNNDMSTSDIFEGKLSFTVDDLGELLKGRKLTKGIVVASSFNFMDLDETNGLFTTLLKRKFLNYIKMLNDIDQTWQMARGPPVPLDYGKLKEAYALRHQIIHELNDPKLTKTQIHGLWENALNIMEIADSVFSSVGNPSEMASYDRDYERGIERDKRRKLFYSYAQRILKKLLDGDIQLPAKSNLTMADLGIGDDTEEIDGRLRVMERRRKWIRISDNVMSITDNGRKKARELRWTS